MLGLLLEWLAGLSSPRFKTFRLARLSHERYGRDHNIKPESITSRQRAEARSSSELQGLVPLYEASLEGARKERAFPDVAATLQQLGLLNFMWGDLSQARSFYSESLSTLHDLPRLRRRDLTAMSTCHYFLALIALESGDPVAAKASISQALEIDKSQHDFMALAMDQEVIERCDNALNF